MNYNSITKFQICYIINKLFKSYFHPLINQKLSIKTLVLNIVSTKYA